MHIIVSRRPEWWTFIEHSHNLRNCNFLLLFIKGGHIQASRKRPQCWVCEAFDGERMRRRHRCRGSRERHNVPPGTLHGPIPSSQPRIWVSRTFASPCAVASMRVPSSSISWFCKTNVFIQKQSLPKVVGLCAAQDDSGDGEGSAEGSASGGLFIVIMSLNSDASGIKLIWSEV